MTNLDKPTKDLEEWLDHQAKARRRLYHRYGKPLEEQHQGEYLAIGFDGQTILGKDDGEVLKKAIEALGRGNFAFVRVGYRSFGRWLSLSL